MAKFEYTNVNTADLCSATTVAERAGVSIQAVTNWVAAGDVPQVDYDGNRPLFFWPDVEEWLAGRGRKKSA